MQLQLIQNRIFEVRGEKVMLDFDLAELYEVETRVFNQSVKRNINSFPKDFMFQLTAKEWKNISSQIVMTSPLENNSSQIVMRSKYRGAKYLPYAFTEHGVAMLSSILKSPIARTMNIAIIRAFIALRKLALQKNELSELFLQLKDRIDEHDVQLKNIYDSIENLLEEKVNTKSWEHRERIGFKK
ncbi:MAG: ORF6N domain-containing protein [Chitinophagaceae bacterium]